MTKIYFSPMRTGSISFQLLLDDALTYVNSHESNKVVFVTCRGELRPCNNNLNSSKLRCLECIGHSKYFENKYAHRQINYISLAKLSESENSGTNHSFSYSSLDDVKKLEYKSIPIGLGIVSSYVSATRNINPIMNGFNRNLLDKLIITSQYLVDSFSSILDSLDLKEVVLFNGRFSGLRDVFESALKNDIKVTTIEYLLTRDNLNASKVMFENALPHDVNYNTKQINELWLNKGIENKEQLASEFFVRRKHGQFSGDKVFTTGQNKDLLPKNWDKSKRNFVIFNSSEDEYYSIGGDWDTVRVFESQNIGINHIIKRLAGLSDIHIYIRIHPNLKNNNFDYVKDLEKINQKNVFIIKADSNISSYKLMECSEKCIVFGSTMGVEATYWSKPVINLANSLYNNLDVAYYPESLVELDNLLLGTLEPKPKLGCLKFGLYNIYDSGESYNYIDYNFAKTTLFYKKLRVPVSLKISNSFIIYKVLYMVTRILDFKHHYTNFLLKKNIRE
ncbi:hypothetical protein N9R33_00330 [Schleiferiaceae bacterium]|nr:hypothetical protein [Schleiferiaceae bacterium]